MSTEKRPEAVAEVQRQLDLAHSQLAIYARDFKRIVDNERQKSRELASANSRLRLLDGLKTDFLSFISHELRTPLTAMLAIDLLDPHGDPQEQAEMISMVRGGYERLERWVVKGLAYFEWAGMEKVETSEVTDLVIVVRLAAERLATGTESERQVVLSAPGASCLVCGEAQHLMEVVQILLDNAVKFSREETEIKVDVHVTAQNVTLTVIDRGQGFPPESASELFRPFTIANITHHSQGTGLSLALAHMMVEAYGGKLWAESEGVGLGATFTAVFPSVSLAQVNDTEGDPGVSV